LPGHNLKEFRRGFIGRRSIMAWRYFAVGFAAAFGLIQPVAAKPLDIEDVLATVSIDKVDPSPDGRDLAVVIQRPVADGEVFGRTAYEIDPSRADVWLVARDGSAKHNLTEGAAQAAGFWCTQWSPDGKRLAMLSTKPEDKERHGGNSVRLYVWTRQGGRLTRLSDRAMMTQTRYGSAMNALDLRLSGDGQGSKGCRRGNENAPFLWLDARRLLVVQMPPGQNSALFTQSDRAVLHSGEAAEKILQGREPTVDISDSDRTVLTPETARYTAEVAVIDTVTGQRRLLGEVPAFPFRGMLSLVVSPDGESVAIAAPSRAIAPPLLGPRPSIHMDAQVEKRLGLVKLDGSAPLRWLPLPLEARYLLDPLGWSPDGTRLALRARKAADERTARVFVLNTQSGEIAAAAPGLSGGFEDVDYMPHQAAAVWRDGALLVRGRAAATGDGPERWWRVAAGLTPQPASAPPGIEREPGLPADAEILTRDAYGVVFQRPTPQGLYLGVLPKAATAPRVVLTLDTHLAAVDWGEIRMIDYTSQSGKALEGLLILPPGYQPQARYPLLVWYYPGMVEAIRGGYWQDPYLPGIYNLQLYAARSYAVLVPSTPLTRGAGPTPVYSQLTDGLFPAIDKVVSLGIADPKRIGLFGQSFGGYGVYGLVTQTDRFAAAVAMAGFTELATEHGAFEPGAVGWPGVAQDKSEIRTILQMTTGFYVPPYIDPAFYAANSPLTYVKNVHTPLLMAHGSLDGRSPIEQAEAFFTELDQQGKPARLLRYEGENHSLAASPANVRDLFGETLAWFDRYLKTPEK
jgi:dipeptidyl aminopeptidase/acylaminoacyl peptidase